MPLTAREAAELAKRVLGAGDVEEDGGAAGDPPPGLSEPEAAGLIPQRIGRCTVRRLISAGGMGVVYEAEQSSPRRTVAIKVMSRQIAARGRAALRRFEYEAQVLARLDHPGIARIYEAGTWDDGAGGVPCFVMEYVADARDLIDYAHAHALGRRERLKLFAKVCDAVHHGHQKGIIHRDLKPANILVPDPPAGLRDEPEPQPKVIDFGVARAADADVTMTMLPTAPGDIVGTLQYMSPEQCEGDPLALDVRSDVYALGVILYELLCGMRPYEVAGAPLSRAVRIVQEETPPRPASIHASLKGDLEAIILKAVEKDPAGRYQSAADLAGDIGRHLAGEPVTARMPGRWVRAVRWVTRHPVVATAAASAVAGLVAAGTSALAVTYIVSIRPHRVAVMLDGREARLLTLNGDTRARWTAARSGGISFAELVPGPEGSDALVVLGFGDRTEPWRGGLHVFAAVAPEKTLWSFRITDDQLPAGLREHGIDCAGFGLTWAIVEDVFPERPGPEILAGFTHTPSSPFAITAHDLEGNLLYRDWHDGGTSPGYWMQAAGRLVVAGLNSEVYWSERGHPDAGIHPIVAFALEPRIGHLGRTWVTPSPGGDTTTLAWYRCMQPPEASKRVGLWQVRPPRPGFDPGRYATFGVRLSGTGYGVSWVIDADGNEVPGTRMGNDRWRIDEPLPEDHFQLGDLPPILPPPLEE